ncbi:MAG: ribosome-inactivating family protein [Spiroplasma phoeniceum]|nr:MAG: ribosome-inactivating family protein [Spiroplasma phoeniceum]UZQ33301.1 MAG: ribosome-inactivating family protein [Spiroplasma phoeniceum]
MKKLLSLLSVLTISGTDVPATIAASPYQKEETKLNNSDVNYSQKNNLEILKRNKRENNNFPIFNLKLSWNSNKYFVSLCNNVLAAMRENNIISSVTEGTLELNCNNPNMYIINSNYQFKYFIIRVSAPDDHGHWKLIDLFFRSNDFYLSGLIYNHNNINTFYHFSDVEIERNENGQTEFDNMISGRNNLEYYNLRFNSNYTTLIGDSNPTIAWPEMVQAFNDLVNYANRPDYPGNIAVIRGALARVILATAESIRFRQVRNNLSQSDRNTFYWRTNFHDTITNWNIISENAINYL